MRRTVRSNRLMLQKHTQKMQIGSSAVSRAPRDVCCGASRAARRHWQRAAMTTLLPVLPGVQPSVGTGGLSGVRRVRGSNQGSRPAPLRELRGPPSAGAAPASMWPRAACSAMPCRARPPRTARQSRGQRAASWPARV